MHDKEKQSVIARPTEEGTFKKTYFYRGKEFSDFKAALKARAEALEKAGIDHVTETEIFQAENEIAKRSGRKQFLGRIDLCTKGGGGDNSELVLEPTETGLDSRVDRSGFPVDGIAGMIYVFAWLSLIGGVIGGIALLSAGIIGVVFIISGLFQFAILSGFSRIIEYLRKISQNTE